MYEFNEERWDAQQAEEGDLGHLAEGWMIKFTQPASDQRCNEIHRFLQIGTGQWCSSQYATLFPSQSTAMVYALEFGLDLQGPIRIVRHRF